ncbi:hypothetical protein LXJ15735_04460 [Lacrimispora xylanolytica]
MEEMETIVSQESKVEAKPEPSRWYEGHISLEDAKTFIKSNITTAARSFIAIGFYLKCVRDRELFKEEDYGTVWDFAKEEYGISKSTASRYMSMNDRFSENGNSPSIREEYKAFGKSQLQEMLYLEDDKLDQIKPGDRVEDIRSLRRPKEIPYIELPGQLDFEIDFPDILPLNQLEQPMISQRQTFEINVEDLLGDNEPGSIAISQQEEKKENSELSLNGEFLTAPLGCPYRTTYSCTIPVENRTVPGDGYNCGSSCCWSCKFHGACKLECNASAGREGALPEYDAAWFVRKWAEVVPEELERALNVCCESFTNEDRAKAVQKEISPYGAHCRSCWEYDFSFNGFAEGIDFRIGKVEIHLKYGRFVQELMNLYPDFEEPVIEEPEIVQEQEDSIPEISENVIDGEYVEILPDQELSARSILEEEKAELHNWIKAFKEEGLEMPPMVERQKIIVAALTAMVEQMEAPKPVKQEQPELPVLKNNEQRAAFIDAYETWPIWIETQETGERYYRYDLFEKVAIVVKVSWKHSWSSYKESKDYEYGAEQYYLMGVKSEWRSGKNVYVEDDTRSFYECGTNRSALVEYLKEFQKSK